MSIATFYTLCIALLGAVCVYLLSRMPTIWHTSSIRTDHMLAIGYFLVCCLLAWMANVLLNTEFFVALTRACVLVGLPLLLLLRGEKIP